MFAGLVGLGGCNDNNNLVGPPVLAGIVTTFNDPAFNFSTLTTFAMPDTIVVLPSPGPGVVINRAFDQTILTRVRQNLTARGFTQVTPSSTVTPSFVVLVGATATDDFNAWPGFPWFAVWGFSPVWDFTTAFNSSWGIVFPWFPTVGVTSYPRGTLVVTLIPTSSINTTAKTVTAAWAGIATAILASSVNTAVVNNSIDQMFAQSTFLVPGPTP
jgi:hypothetical protein